MLRLAYFILRQQYERLRLQHGALLGEDNAHNVHAMRVTTRKIRAALRLFREMLPEPARTTLQEELRWLAAELGRARDSDVFCATLQACRKQLDAQDAAVLDYHLQHLAAARSRVGRIMIEALGSSRCASLFERYAGFVSDQPSPFALNRWSSFRICDGVSVYLDKSLRRIAKRGRRIGKRSPARELHRLRIDVKRYRYLLEYFLPLYKRKLKRPLKATRCLQNLLGEHQDACVAETHIRAAAKAIVSADELVALGRLVELQAQKAARSRKSFPNAWRRFKAVQPSLPLMAR